MKISVSSILVFTFMWNVLVGCSSNDAPGTIVAEPETPQVPDPTDDNDDVPESGIDVSSIYRGADLSYVNEMIDCGAVYKNQEGEEIDVYTHFKEMGTNLVRVRLWHTPDWTSYSNFEDVKQTIKKAKENNMEVLLDFHYSDTWADPAKQIIPKAWEETESVEILADSVYNYTYKVLNKLSNDNLLPDIVQVGNEINREILQPENNHSTSINWSRNAKLINSGLQAVKDISEEKNRSIETMLHIAQPENAIWWFREAEQNGIVDFTWIGLSYYPIWSSYNLNRVPEAIEQLKNTHQKRIMIVETAYPHTLEDVDNANNILGETALISGYPATPQGQKDYMMDLLTITTEAGAEGVIYWEPAWVSTNCSTLWGQGSHWDNATLFDSETGEALPGFDFYNPENY